MRIEGVASPNTILKSQPVSKEADAHEGKIKYEGKINDNEARAFRENEKQKVTEEEIIEAIEKANKDFIVYDKKFEFTIHDETKEIMVKVLDARTNEVIREIPPEKILDMVAKMWELAGILIDERA